MTATRFYISLPNDNASTKAAELLPYRPERAVFHGNNAGKDDGLAAWIVRGNPLSAAWIEKHSAREISTEPVTANAAGANIARAARAARADRDHVDGKRPTFTLYAVEDPLRPLLTVHPCSQEKVGPEGYSVKDSSGNLLCTISKGRSPLGVRRAWRATLPTTQKTFVGYRGTSLGWLVFILLLPLWVPLTLISVLIGVLDSGVWDDLTWGFPSHTKWRRSGVLFASAALRGRSGKYTGDTTLIDPRIAYALAVLHSTR